MPDALMLSVSGCRGIMGTSLTPEVASRFAGAFGAFLRDQAKGRGVCVVLGRDGRRGGEMVRSAAVAGLLASGSRVIDLGVAMTPTTAVMTDYYAAQLGQGTLTAGMVITASHNPQPWNGLKCLLPSTVIHGSSAAAPPAPLASEIIARFQAGPTDGCAWNAIGTVREERDAAETHVERVIEALEAVGISDPSTIGAGLGVAVDSVNASGVAGARLLLDRLGVTELMHLGMETSGIFPHPPEPVAENLGQPDGLCDAVLLSQAAVGFAQDPDADRLALIDEKGAYVGEEYTLALSALALLELERRAGRETRGMKLATNLSTSRMLDDVAARYGATVRRTAVGEANVVDAMKADHALAGGEGNGGIIWPRVTFVRDSLSGMALILWLIKTLDKPLSQIAASIPSYAIEKRKVDLPRREAATIAIERISSAYGSRYRVDRQDGAWVDLADKRAWLHVRASNTEPIMRLIAEAPTAGEAKSLLDEAARIIG